MKDQDEGLEVRKLTSVGSVSKAVRDSSRVLQQLLQIIKGSKVVGLITRMTSRGGGKPMLEVNIEISGECGDRMCSTLKFK